MGCEKKVRARWWYRAEWCWFLMGCICAISPGNAQKMLIRFEEFLGQDGSEIGDFYPGVRFDALSSGEDWIVSDVKTVYVDRDAPGTVQNGTCWAYAYQDLQDALARAARGCGSEIRVADGVYGSGDNYSDSFTLPEGGSVYGGYAGYGTADPDARDPKRYQTILSG